jgi:hypothetical protein
MGYRKGEVQQCLETRVGMDARKDKPMTLRDDVTEISRLQDAWHEMIDGRDKEIATLRAEVARLRDVLEWVENNCPSKCAGVIRPALTMNL